MDDIGRLLGLCGLGGRRSGRGTIGKFEIAVLVKSW